jgi:hypothetical protein
MNTGAVSGTTGHPRRPTFTTVRRTCATYQRVPQRPAERVRVAGELGHDENK